VIYFDSDILPILIGNCAIAGCHDPISAQHELVLTSYEALILHDDVIVPFELDKSELYEKITEDKISDRMPPFPNEALTEGQILKIRKWILQGAQNTACNNGSPQSCDTTLVSFTNDVKPIFDTYCITCHGSNNPNAGVSLISYNGASVVAKTGKLLGVVKWINGFLMMPLGGNQIPECDINTISAWINQGVANN
jgi:mono/diheme cytochrome c family protein